MFSRLSFLVLSLFLLLFIISHYLFLSKSCINIVVFVSRVFLFAPHLMLLLSCLSEPLVAQLDLLSSIHMSKSRLHRKIWNQVTWVSWEISRYKNSNYFEIALILIRKHFSRAMLLRMKLCFVLMTLFSISICVIVLLFFSNLCHWLVIGVDGILLALLLQCVVLTECSLELQLKVDTFCRGQNPQIMVCNIILSLLIRLLEVADVFLLYFLQTRADFVTKAKLKH